MILKTFKKNNSMKQSQHTTVSILLLAASLLLAPLTSASAVNITPVPRQLTLGRGTLVLPNRLDIDTKNLPDSFVCEARKFACAVSSATSVQAVVSATGKGQIKLVYDASFPKEGYSLVITPRRAVVKASAKAGLFYAFQTVMRLLPPNIAMGVRDTTIHSLSLPSLTINDEPRFEYRGFMLDVSRHFFGPDEIKRLLRLMAVYKMNRFHWHLTDDQGWRIEIKQYPRLTSIGSKSHNCRMNDMKNGVWWLNDQYGPHFYTQEQVADIVNYARELHIEVIPEIDMPGHFSAAMAAYPQYSCNPAGLHNVQIHQGGVWDDVLNVGDPLSVQFAKNILTEICRLFPSRLIHIGGDECPTTAWEGNALCRELFTGLGLNSYRQLQSRFIKQMSDHVAAMGRRLVVWNESVTAQGADLDLIGRTGATVMSWHPCQQGALVAAGLKLPVIVTEYHTDSGSYYINRRQSQEPGEPLGAGNGDDTVERCYSYRPVPSSVPDSLKRYYCGIQATFWTEWVSDRAYLEYLAIPRLMAVAETAWSPEDRKDFGSFCRRMAADTSMLRLGGYNYATHIFRTRPGTKN